MVPSMQKLKLTDRACSPAFFDMAFRCRPANAKWYGKVFRIGDKAVIRTYLDHWRKNNPHRKLFVLTSPEAHETPWSRTLRNDWVFGGVADEILTLDSDKEPILRLHGENLYTQPLFTLWGKLHRCGEHTSNIQVPFADTAAALSRLKDWNVPHRYAVISPLMDAMYDQHRNLSVQWWMAVIRLLSRHIPVVVTGDHTAMQRLPPAQTGNVFPIYKNSPTPMHSLALIQGASVFIGGETGMTLWAGLLRVPTVAAYVYWDPPWWKNKQRNMDPRPISFGAPIKWTYPQHGPDMAVEAAISIARRG